MEHLRGGTILENKLKEVNKEPSEFEKIHMISVKMMELLLEASQKRVPENGKFSKFSLTMQFPDERYFGTITVDFGSNPRTERTVAVGVYPAASNRMVSNYVFWGTKKELLTWFSDSETADELANSFIHLREVTQNRD